MIAPAATIAHPVERARPPYRELLAACWRIARRTPVSVVAGTLLAIDLAFALIQVAVIATDYGFNGAFRLSLETEFGIASIFGFTMLGTSAFLLLTAWRRFASAPAALWAAVLVYLAMDDAWTIHESLGSFFANRYGLEGILGLRAQDVGELMAYAMIGVITLAALVITERRAADPLPSTITRLMLALVGLLVFFAVVVDLVGGFLMPDLIGISVEDGGELVAMTFILVGAWIWTDRADELVAELGA